MTQDEFASRLGVTPQAVSKWERGDGLPDVSLEANSYRVLVYETEVIKGTADTEDEQFYQNLIQMTADYCRENYADVINKHIVKIMIDNLKNQYPGVADGIVPEKISYFQLEQKLKEKLQAGESIKNLIQIIEGLGQNI